MIINHRLDFVESSDVFALRFLLSAFINQSITTYYIPHKL